MAQTPKAAVDARTRGAGRSGGAEAVGAELDYRPSYLAATIAGLCVLALYIFTLAPTTAMWDTSEYIAAAYTMGLPHPPGNPFFILLGRVFTILPIAPNVAMRVNILAALSAAVSATMWFLITERVLVGWFAERWQRIVGGALAALIGATAFTVWSQSVVNEKVYTVSLAGVAIIAWLTVRWCDESDSRKTDKLLILIAYLLGLGYANHMAGFIAAPAVAVAVLLWRPATILRWRLILACVGALMLGFTPFATQPIRAAYFPAVNEGEPTGCRTEFSLKCTFSKATVDAFMYNFNRGQYSKPPITERQAPFAAQVEMWWLYFKWQWVRDPYGQFARPQAMMGAVFLLLGLFGGYVHWRRDRRSFAFFAPMMFSMTLLLIFYLNFKYGATQGGEQCDVTIPCEVRDRDYFFLWSFSAWSVWAALGLIFVWESLAALVGSSKVKVGKEVVDIPHKGSWLKTSPVVLVAFVPLFANWHSSSRRGDTDTRDFAYDMLNSVEPYGVLVTVGDNDTFPIWYAQEVEHIRQDVILVNTSLSNTDWYPRQIIRRKVFEYDKEKGPAIYRDRDWPKPPGPPLHMTLDEIDRVDLVRSITTPMLFKVEGTDIAATISKPEFWKADYMVLRMIQDSYKERPIYFSRTSGPYGKELGLDAHLMTQGLAQKLLYHVPKAAGRDTLLLEEGWFDLRRTIALWDSVYQAPASLLRKNKWIDFPSQGIPYLYFATGVTLGHALQVAGDSAQARKVLLKSADLYDAVKLGFGIGQPGVSEQVREMARGPVKTEAETSLLKPVTPPPPTAGKKGGGQ